MPLGSECHAFSVGDVPVLRCKPPFGGLKVLIRHVHRQLARERAARPAVAINPMKAVVATVASPVLDAQAKFMGDTCDRATCCAIKRGFGGGNLQVNLAVKPAAMMLGYKARRVVKPFHIGLIKILQLPGLCIGCMTRRSSLRTRSILTLTGFRRRDFNRAQSNCISWRNQSVEFVQLDGEARAIVKHRGID